MVFPFRFLPSSVSFMCFCFFHAGHRAALRCWLGRGRFGSALPPSVRGKLWLLSLLHLGLFYLYLLWEVNRLVRIVVCSCLRSFERIRARGLSRFVHRSSLEELNFRADDVL